MISSQKCQKEYEKFVHTYNKEECHYKNKKISLNLSKLKLSFCQFWTTTIFTSTCVILFNIGISYRALTFTFTFTLTFPTIPGKKYPLISNVLLNDKCFNHQLCIPPIHPSVFVNLLVHLFNYPFIYLMFYVLY